MNKPLFTNGRVPARRKYQSPAIGVVTLKAPSILQTSGISSQQIEELSAGGSLDSYF